MSSTNPLATSPDLPTISNLSLSNTKQLHRPKPSSLPTTLVRTLSLSSHSPPIELILQLFSDRIFLSITQLKGKLGSLLLCNIEESVIDNSTTYNIQTLLGAGGTDVEVSRREVLVRQIASRILTYTKECAGISSKSVLGEDGNSCLPPLVVGMGLGKEFVTAEFGVVVEGVMELYVQAMGGGRMLSGGMECPD